MSKIKCPKCQHVNTGESATCSRCGTVLPKVHVEQSPRAPGPKGPRGSGPARPNPFSFQRGQNVANRYTVIKMIGRGGMGCIYLVQDNVLKEQVALKTLLPEFARDRTVVERFYNEARIARQLSHPNVVRVHDIGIADQVMYISMEHLSGKALRTVLDELMPGDRLPVKTTLRIMDQLCAALEYAHDFTVHRDIKPENVMILDDGSVKLMDFGISKLMANTRLTSTAMVMGTPHYMSPEQLKDSSTVDARADLYSLGVMLYEILAGNLPTGVPKPASQITRDVPPALDPIVEKCVDPDPAKRYQSAGELRQALQGVLQVLESGTKPAPRASTARAAAGTARKAGGIALAALVLATAGFGIWRLDLRRRELLATTPEIEVDANAVVQQQCAALLGRLDEARARAAEAVGESEDKQGVLSLAEAMRDAAQRAAAGARLDDTARLAQRAVVCYGVVADWPEGMVFVPAEGEVDAFLIDAAPVTVRDFVAFDEEVEGHWRGYTMASCTEEMLDSPVTSLPLYDALAFAAWKGKRLPTEAQWLRAAQHRPELMAVGMLEWTRSAWPGLPYLSGDQREDPAALDFSVPMVVYAAHADESEELRIEPLSRPFETPDPAVGFRCVVELGPAD
ncbi:MAG: protein kinase [Candidatus Hydrogenedentes bacterium]|nr:protein kinase [Candidatus Hydrogenedentota bacterium]